LIAFSRDQNLANLGIERFNQSNQYKVVFNLKTAKELGITVEPDISKAAKVIQ